MIAWVFDVDGVLCDSGLSMPEDFKSWFLEWSKDKSIFLVTGSQKEKTIQQIGQEIFDRALVSYNCQGNSIWVNGEEFQINTFDLSQEQIEWLEDCIQQSEFPHKTGEHISKRTGSVNFSIPGRNANTEIRNIYKIYDQEKNERLEIIKKFVDKFPRFEAFLGGEISIDICRRGANKSQAYYYIKQYWGVQSIKFFADKVTPEGIDYPFVRELRKNKGVDKLYTVNGYQQTWDRLKTL